MSLNWFHSLLLIFTFNAFHGLGFEFWRCWKSSNKISDGSSFKSNHISQLRSLQNASPDDKFIGIDLNTDIRKPSEKLTIIKELNRNFRSRKFEVLLKDAVQNKRKELINSSTPKKSPFEVERLPISLYRKDQILIGRIVSIKSYGLWVDFGCTKNGFLHIKDISETWIEDINSLFNLGQEIVIKIKFLDTSRGIIGLTNLELQETQKKPISHPLSTLQVEDYIRGRVKKITNYGIFIDINSEVDGFLHISDLYNPMKDGRRHLPSHYYKLNDIIDPLYIKGIDLVRKRVQLSARNYEEELNLRLDLGKETPEEQDNYAPTKTSFHQRTLLDPTEQLNLLDLKGSMGFRSLSESLIHPGKRINPSTELSSFYIGNSRNALSKSSIYETKNIKRYNQLPISLEKPLEDYSHNTIDNAIDEIRFRLSNYMPQTIEEEEYGNSFEENIFNNLRIVLESKEDKLLDEFELDLPRFLANLDHWDEATERIAPLIFKDRHIFNNDTDAHLRKGSMSNKSQSSIMPQNFNLGSSYSNQGNKSPFKGLVVENKKQDVNTTEKLEDYTEYFELYNQPYDQGDNEVQSDLGVTMRLTEDNFEISEMSTPNLYDHIHNSSNEINSNIDFEQDGLKPDIDIETDNIEAKEAHLYVENLIRKLKKGQYIQSHLKHEINDGHFSKMKSEIYKSQTFKLQNNSQSNNSQAEDIYLLNVNERFPGIGFDLSESYISGLRVEENDKIGSQSKFSTRDTFPNNSFSSIKHRKMQDSHKTRIHSLKCKWIKDYVDEVMLRKKPSSDITNSSNVNISNKLKFSPFIGHNESKDLERIKIKALLSDTTFQELLKLSGLDHRKLREDKLDIKLLENFPKKFIYKRPGIRGS